MPSIRRTVPIACLIGCLGVLLFALAACQPADQDQDFEYLPLYSDGTDDTSDIAATVAGVDITHRDMELRLDELKPARRAKYRGPEGQRLLLKEMIDKLILVQDAVDLGLYNDQDVARTLNIQRRQTLETAMKNIGILRGQVPSEDEMMQFFMENRDKYQKQGAVLARHIECASKADIDAAWEKLSTGEWTERFEVQVKNYSINQSTKPDDGDMGWFNKGGYLPHVPNPEQFTAVAYDLQDGLNPPVKIGDRWHIIEIRQREHGRGMTFQEALTRVEKDIMPGYQAGLIDDYLRQARKEREIEYFGVFAPGQGLSVDELFAMARAVADPNRKLELFEMIVTDFPESDRADDALFLAGNICLDEFSDRREGGKLLLRIVREYPDSELAGDAQYILDHMNDPKAMKPSSIEDLKK